MAKEIWLPDSQTHVVVEDGRVKIWDTMTMTKQLLTKNAFGLSYVEKKEEKE